MKSLFNSFIFISLLTGGNLQAADLKIALVGNPGRVQPYGDADFLSRFLRNFAMRPMTSYDRKWQVTCNLCQSIPAEQDIVEFTDDATKTKQHGIRWTLRSDLKWQDGSAIVAEDVVATIKFLKKNVIPFDEQHPIWQIRDVQVDNDQNRQFTLIYSDVLNSHFDLSWLYLFPAAQVREEEKSKEFNLDAYFSKEFFQTKQSIAIQNGPGSLQQVNAQEWQISEFDDDKKIVNTWHIKIFEHAEDVLTLMKHGQAFDLILGDKEDFEPGARRSIDLQKSAKAAGLIELNQAINILDLMVFNTRNPALASKYNRQKLANALKKANFNDSSNNFYFHKSHFFLHPDAELYRLATAGVLPDAVKSPEQEERDVKTQLKNIELTIRIADQPELRQSLAAEAVKAWQRMGVKAEVISEKSELFFSDTLKKLNFRDLAIFAIRIPADQSWQSLLQTNRVPSLANEYSGQNYAAFGRVHLDNLLKAQLSEWRLAERAGLFKNVLQILAVEVPYMPLGLRQRVAFVNGQTLPSFFLHSMDEASSQKFESWSIKPTPSL